MVGAGRLGNLTVGASRLDGRQGVKRPRSVQQLDVCVAPKREGRRRVAGQFLGHLDVRAAGHQAADVRVPQGVEVCHAACAGAVCEEV